MTEKQPSREELEAQEKIEAPKILREFHINYLTSRAVNDAYIASVGNDETKYGPSIKSATKNNYISALKLEK